MPLDVWQWFLPKLLPMLGRLIVLMFSLLPYYFSSRVNVPFLIMRPMVA